MKVHFKLDKHFSAQDPQVLVQADALTGEARDVLDYLDEFSSSSKQVLPIKTDDHLVMIKIDEIIFADIDQSELTIFTVDGFYTTKESLTHFQSRINRRSFLQVSRHAIINIDHLESLSDSFSGNMTAKLTRQLKTSVSRKYVKALMAYLGI